MDKSQWYIGAPNGIVLCIDCVKEHQFAGCFYHRYQEAAVTFVNTEQMLFQLEFFFDKADFPHPTTTERTFQERTHKRSQVLERDEKMSDKELLRKHGELGTFVVRVQHRQNSSWQGRITWMEQNKTLCFRSVWEMVKLIASVVEKSDEEQEPSWVEKNNGQ